MDRQLGQILLGDGHHSIVVTRGPIEGGEFVGDGVHLEPLPEAAQHHVAGIAPGDQDTRLGEELADHRQADRGGRRLVDEDPAVRLAAELANPTPIGLAPFRGAGAIQREQALQSVAITEERLIGVLQGRLFPPGRSPPDARPGRSPEASSPSGDIPPGTRVLCRAPNQRPASARVQSTGGSAANQAVRRRTKS